MMPTANPEAPGTGLRALKKQRTHEAIQAAALRLFAERGYDAVTCEQIAAKAEVAPATFYRHFPTKEDVVLSDNYDPLVAARVAGRPAGESPLRAVQATLTELFGSMGPDERRRLHDRSRLALAVPAIRARISQQQKDAEDVLAIPLAARMGRRPDDLEVRAVTAAILAAATVAVESWAATGGDLSEHLNQALAALAHHLAP